MSLRGEVRKAVKDWLDGGNIPYLDVVFTAPPLRLDFNQYSRGDHQCQAVVYVDDEMEQRIALGGPHSGKKRIDYTVSVEFYFRTIIPDPEASVDAVDELVDAAKVRLRADRQLGQPDDIVWQAGEGAYGIHTQFADPDSNIGGEPIEHYARLQFEVTRWITS